tara:strand:- start:340 stop:1083 length:744 start_codon:yes stop_codon:yes gene_type:complete
MKKTLITLASLWLISSSPAATVNTYDSHVLLKWPVYVNTSISDKSEEVYLPKLEKSLKSIEGKLPKYAYDYLRDSGLKIIVVPPHTIKNDFKMLYVMENTSNWTRKYEKFLDNSVVIPTGLFSNLDDFNFLYFMTHELAHHYHFSFVGYSNEYVWRKYWHAKRDPNYPLTYGLENHVELFAELSVNFFIMREKLAKIDKEGMNLMNYIWGEKFFKSGMKLYNSLPTVDMKAIMERETARKNKIFNIK